MPAGSVVSSGTNSNMNGIRIESRVLAPPGGFSSLSFGDEPSNTDKFKHHDFNPKNQKKQKDEENSHPAQNNVVKTVATQEKPTSSTVVAPAEPQLRPGRRGRGAGESSISLGWD